MPKAVIFDVDGTLVDTNDLHAEAWVEAFAHFGITVSAASIRPQIGKGSDQLLPVFLDPERLDRDGEHIAKYRSDLFARDYLDRSRAFPGVRPLFERLREAGKTVVLGSSSNTKEIEHHMRLAGITDLVDEVTSADDAERSKPAPDIFGAALERIAPIGAEDTVVVGDTPYDAQAAAKLGMRTIGLLCGGFPEAKLKAAGCIALYRDPEALLRDFEGSPLA